MPARIALALGAARPGYAHIGVINELRDRGHQIASVVGSSMGALVGGVFAAGQLDGFTDWVLGLSQGFTRARKAARWHPDPQATAPKAPHQRKGPDSEPGATPGYRYPRTPAPAIPRSSTWFWITAAALLVDSGKAPG